MMRNFKRMVVFLAVAALASCAQVRQEDLASWQGQPVSKLDGHPLFLAMDLEVRRLPDGTEVRNYVNGKQVGQCFGNARTNAYGQLTVQTTAKSFCSTSFAACNNMFFIKDGIVQRYTPVGSGGARCYTDETAQPDGWRGKQLKS